MFLGIFFVLFGLSILLKVVFHIHIPVFRSVFAIFLIYLGVKMLFGGGSSCHWKASFHGGREGNGQAIFSEEQFKGSSEERQQYQTIFGSAQVDLSAVDVSQKDVEVEVHTVFGETRVKLNPKIPTQIMASSVFGEARMPNEDMVAFGSLKFKNGDLKPTDHSLKIKAHVVFGSIKFLQVGD